MFENSPAGIPIWGKIISAILFVDDLVLIGKTKEDAMHLLKVSQSFFERSGMEINITKSNILSAKDIINLEVHLSSITGT